MSEKSVVFLPYKLHLRYFLFALAKRVPVTVLLPPEKSLPQNTKLTGVRINYLEFGTNFLKKFVGGEVRTQKYVAGLSKLLDKQNMQALVTCEFYHWYTLQSIAYKKRKRGEFKLFVISETKRWPHNKVAHFLKRILLFYFKLNLKYVDGIFVYTESARDFLIKYIPQANIKLLPVPTDTERFNLQSGKELCHEGHLRLLMNARYSPYKRHKDIFAAILNLHNRGKRVRLTCISRYEEDKESIANLAKEMGVAGIVDVVGALSVEQMPELYHAHDVLVLPSYNEAIGMVVPEAMACGLPTITSDTVGANVYVKDRETGFVYKTGNVSALITAIEPYFDTKLLDQMGKAANKHIIDNFTAEAVAPRFYSLISMI